MKQYIIQQQPVGEKVTYLVNAENTLGYIWARFKDNATRFLIEEMEHKLVTMPGKDIKMRITYSQVEGREPPKGWGELDFKKDYNKACNDIDDIEYAQESIIKEYMRKGTISPERLEEIIHNNHTKHTTGYERKDIVINLNNLDHDSLVLLDKLLTDNMDIGPAYVNNKARDITQDYLKVIHNLG